MADPQHGPFPLSYVLTHELRELRPVGRQDAAAAAAARLPSDLAADSDNPEVETARRGPVYRAAHKADLSALCLSGGGIRSASFCLGVIQALAETKLLDKFDYLSTVSGGGYIGAWLSAWLCRAPDKTAVLGALYSRRAAEGLPFPGADPDPAREPAAIVHLREYSNYLTAKTGLMSADTWTALAIVLRNLLLNWLILLPVIVLAVVVLKLFAVLIHYLASFDAIYLALGLFLLTAWSFSYKLYRLYGNNGVAPRDKTAATPDGAAAAGAGSFDPARAQSRFLSLSLFPAVVAGIGFAAFAIRRQVPIPAPPLNGWRSWLTLVVFAVLALLVAELTAWIAVCASRGLPARSRGAHWDKERQRWIGWQILSWIFAAIAFGSALWFGVYLASRIDMGALPVHASKEIVLVILGVPWFLLAAMLAHTVYLLFCTYSPWGDVEREWLGRASGWYFIAGIAWIVFSAVVLLGPKLYFDSAIIFNDARAWIAAIGASGGATAWLGKTGRTPAQGGAKGLPGVSLNIAAGIAATLFAVLLLILLSSWADGVFLYFAEGAGGSDRACFSVAGAVAPSCWNGWVWLALGGALVAIAAVAGFFVNVNRYTLHAIYRNRLVRAYLGGSRTECGAARELQRRPDPFTGFDWDDNLRVKDLWPRGRRSFLGHVDFSHRREVDPAPWRPFHVINMTLNLAATRNLAWQQRKAMSFAVTPLFSGAASLGYRETSEYGDPQNGISLGTALAISGAAVSSNMGYHSSPPLAFLLTLFNVRLGWWLGNPKVGDPSAWQRRLKRLTAGRSDRPVAAYRQDAPWFAVFPLLSELFGLMNEDSPYVYLSDGGHFENLGTYEMVRRRCKWIIAIDAAADPKRGFEDLGNAMRKIWIDLGARITFSESVLLEAAVDAKPDEVPYFALGNIEYEGDRNGDAAPPTGRILYIKAGVRGDEAAADVIAYWRANPEFPNQSTIDQWFDEPQLEAYRVLGYLIVRRLVAAAAGPQYAASRGSSLGQLFALLDKLDPKTLKTPTPPVTV